MIDDVFTRKSVSEEDYEILGLTSSATLDEVTNRYHVLSKKNHPDAEGGSSFIFKQIVAAYERIRADRVGSSHQPGHPDPADGRNPPWPFRRSAGHGQPASRPPVPTRAWAWWVSKAGQWRWAWVTAAVLLLLAVIGTLSFAGGADSNGDAPPVVTPTPRTTPPSAPIATRSMETPARSPGSATAAAPVSTTTEPTTTVPPPVACPTGTLTATGGVSVVTDSVASGQWQAVVSGSAGNDMQRAGLHRVDRSAAREPERVARRTTDRRRGWRHDAQPGTVDIHR